MDRTYESGAAGSPPSAPASPSSGYPTAGNPSLAVPATKPGPWWYHMIAEELMAVVLAAGLTPDHTDTNQLLDALRAAGVFQTAAQFDSDTSVATTEFIKRHGVEYSTIATYVAPGTLTAAAAGQFAVLSIGGGGTMTLPSASAFVSGTSILFQANGANQIVARQGSDLIYTSGGVSLTSITMGDGDTLLLVSNGSTNWSACGGSAQIGKSAAFGNSFAANGYQKLPSGFIVQWGAAMGSTSADTTVNFPITFPSVVYAITATPNSAAANPRCVSVGNFSALSFAFSAFISNTGVRAAEQITWMAIGK